MICYGNKLIGGVGVIEETVTPTPPEPEYDLFCPQTLEMTTTLDIAGRPNPLLRNNSLYISIVVSASAFVEIQGRTDALVPWVGNRTTMRLTVLSSYANLTEERIADYKREMQRQGRPMTEETEQWLKERIGGILYHIRVDNTRAEDTPVLVAYSATHFESKPLTVI